MYDSALLYFSVVNILAFFIFGVDKSRAIRHQRRIPERVLLTVACIGGSVGAWFAILFFRHKTKKTLFRFAVISFLFIHFLLYVTFFPR